jgi:hypothetical protein
MEFEFDIQPRMLPNGEFQARNDESLVIENGDVPWLFTSQASGLQRCQLPLVGKDDPPSTYKVKLYFAELDPKSAPGDRVFDVQLQGTAVASKLDVVKEAGGPLRALIREFSGVRVDGNLVIELSPVTGQPILSAIEVERE